MTFTTTACELAAYVPSRAPQYPSIRPVSSKSTCVMSMMPLLACDHAVLLKRIIKAAARKHGFIACFMAKPFEEAGWQRLARAHEYCRQERQTTISPRASDKTGLSHPFPRACGTPLAGY